MKVNWSWVSLEGAWSTVAIVGNLLNRPAFGLWVSALTLLDSRSIIFLYYCWLNLNLNLNLLYLKLRKLSFSFRTIVGIVLYIVKIEVIFVKISIKFLSRVSFKISGHFRISWALTNLKYSELKVLSYQFVFNIFVCWTYYYFHNNSMPEFHIKAAKLFYIFLMCSYNSQHFFN